MVMRKILKQVVGIDVAQKELVVCLGKMYDDWKPELYGHKTFPNTLKGFASFVEWVNKLTDRIMPVRFVMEATGVYHESLAYYLDDQQLELSIILPNKISNYARSLDVKTVTDKTASQAICMFGLERNTEKWKRPNPLFKKLRQLSRERGQLIQMRTISKNQLHAEQSEAQPNSSSVARSKKLISFFDKQELEVKQEMAELSKKDNKVNNTIKLIRSVPGVGLITAVNILAETNGFEMIRNKRQLTSYAGLDVKEKQSGTSVKGKPKISKQGNKYLRKAMHLPALTAIRHDQRFKAIFARLVSKHGIKMKAVVAVQRKLLEITYTVFKTNKPYQKDYLAIQNEQLEEMETK
jgi:transposase